MKQRIILLMFILTRLAAGGHTLALKECVELGVARNLSLANARIDVAKGRNGLSQNRARLLPVINGVFQFTDYLKQPVNVTTGTLLGSEFSDDPTWQTIRSMQYNVNAGVQLNVPVYNQSIYAAVDVARTVEQLSRVSYEKAVDDLTMQIAKTYYLAQLSLEQVTLTGENISRMQQLCEITEAMYDQGLVLEVDLNRARINLQNLVTLQGGYDVLYAQQKNMLRFLLDLSPETPLDVERMSGDVDRQLSAPLDDSLPELRLAMIQKNLVEKKISAAKAGYIPSISLTGYAGGLGYQERFSHFFHTKESSQNWFGNCFVGVNISIPIFDANSKKTENRTTQIRNRAG